MWIKFKTQILKPVIWHLYEGPKEGKGLKSLSEHLGRGYAGPSVKRRPEKMAERELNGEATCCE